MYQTTAKTRHSGTAHADTHRKPERAPLSDQRYDALMKQLARMVATEEAKSISEQQAHLARSASAPAIDPKAKAAAVQEILALLAKHGIRPQDLA